MALEGFFPEGLLQDFLLWLQAAHLLHPQHQAKLVELRRQEHLIWSNIPKYSDFLLQKKMTCISAFGFRDISADVRHWLFVDRVSNLCCVSPPILAPPITMASLLFRRFLDNSFCAPPAKQNLSVEEDGGWPSCRHRQLLWEARSSQLLCEKQLAFLWEAASSCDWRTTDRWASRTHQLPVRAASDTGFHQALNIRFQQRFKQKISHKIQTQDFARALNISPVFEDNISLEFKENISQEFWKYYCARALNMSMIWYHSI